MIGLIDCNNFFVSCERVFNPRLNQKPVLVLSNNDGCVISRSNEAKALGIKMGTPYFKIRALIESEGIYVRSSNIALYGDMSRRVMSIIRKQVPMIEAYSIDECFMDLCGIQNLATFGKNLSAMVAKWTGIPVSVGIAPNKTLAKIASKFAKKYQGYEGCCLIDNDSKREKSVKLTPIGDVWGIGRQSGPHLDLLGIHTAYDLCCMKESSVRNLLKINGVRTWKELWGKKIFPMEFPTQKKSITSSRSFKTSVSDLNSLRTYVANFAAACAERLRRDGTSAAAVSVYIRTDAHREDLPQYSDVSTIKMTVPTSDVREIVSASYSCLSSIYKKGFAYKKASVTVSDIYSSEIQLDLFDPINRLKQQKLLTAIDLIKKKNGKSSLSVASQEDLGNAVRHDFRSPCFTTKLSEIISVN